MGILFHSDTGPEPVPELRELLSRRVKTIEGEEVMCPFCLCYQKNKKCRKVGSHACTECGKTFFVAKLGRKSFLASKRAIDDDFLDPQAAGGRAAHSRRLPDP